MKDRLDELYDGTDSGAIKWKRYRREHFFCFLNGNLIELIMWHQPNCLLFHLFEYEKGARMIASCNSESKGAYLLRDLFTLVSNQVGMKIASVFDLKQARISGAGSRTETVISHQERNYLPEIVNSTARIPLVEDIRAIVENLFESRQTKGREDTLSAILVSLLKSSDFFLKHTFFDFLKYSGFCPDQLTYSSGNSVAGTPISVEVRPDIWISDKKEDTWDRAKDPIPGDTKFNIIIECKFGAKFTDNQLRGLGPLKTALKSGGGHCLLLHLGIKPIDPNDAPFQKFGGNPFDREITWKNLIDFSKSDLQKYGDRDALLSIAMIQALDRALGNVLKAESRAKYLVEFLIQRIKIEWKVAARRQNNEPFCIRIDSKMLIEVRSDNSLFVSEIPANSKHQMALGAFFHSDLRGDSKNLVDLMSRLKRFYVEI